MNTSTRRGAQFVQIAIPTVCWKHVLQTYQIWAFWLCQFQRIFVVESVFFSFKTDLWLSRNPCKCHRGICRFAKWIVDNQFIYQAVYERRVWRYQRGNQNPYIEEEHTTQWPKEKAEKDKQRSTKHTYKTKDRVTRTPLRTGDELRCSGTVSSSAPLLLGELSTGTTTYLLWRWQVFTNIWFFKDRCCASAHSPLIF